MQPFLKARCEVEEDCARHRTQTFLIRLVMKNYSLWSYLSILVQQGTENFFLYSESYFLMALYGRIIQAVLFQCISSGMQPINLDFGPAVATKS